jgi:porphobilinogen deaminase
MKNLTEFLLEQFVNNKATIIEAETITDEKSFREAARVKFEEVFGDELDEEKMNKTIDGLLEDNKDLVEKGEWGELIGILNKSFAPESDENKE